MKTLLFLAIFLTVGHLTPAFSQTNILENTSGAQPEAMLFGVFHFAYPNQDIIKTSKEEQLDITTPENQNQIEKITRKLSKFRPTKIAVEVMTEKQAYIDSLYQAYVQGNYNLHRGEVFQIGFRLAKQLGHERVYCIDTWGNMEAYTKPGAKDFDVRDDLKPKLETFWAYQDSVVNARANLEKRKPKKPNTLYKTLLELNKPANIKKDHANYFREAFMYEHAPYHYTGTDWYSASWYNRNLRIFRNIQRITQSPADRILVIYGAGHMALLHHAIESSGSYKIRSAYKMIR